MRDNIINVLKNCDKAVDIYELQDLLGITSSEEISLLLEELQKLEDEVIIYRSNKDKYMMIEKSHLRKGIMRVNKKGFGFVEVDDLDDDIYIASDHMNGAIHDDIVLVEITSKMNLDRLEGRVLRIVERRIQRYIGVIHFDAKGEGHIILDDSKIKLEIEIPKDHTLNAVDGHKVVVNVLEFRNKGTCVGEVEKILGHVNDPGVDILAVVEKYEIKSEWDQETIDELETVKSTIGAEMFRREYCLEFLDSISMPYYSEIREMAGICKEPKNFFSDRIAVGGVDFGKRRNNSVLTIEAPYNVLDVIFSQPKKVDLVENSINLMESRYLTYYPHKQLEKEMDDYVRETTENDRIIYKKGESDDFIDSFNLCNLAISDYNQNGAKRTSPLRSYSLGTNVFGDKNYRKKSRDRWSNYLNQKRI